MERKCSCGNFFDVRECSGICPECKTDIFELNTKPMSKQQTALQQFHEALLSGKITDTLANIDYYLELERKQIIDAYDVGEEDGYWHPEIGYSRKYKDAEQYYNDKYGK